MASIHKEFTVEADVASAWDAVRDVGAVHQRLVPGMVTQTQLDAGVRTVHFANGLVVREAIVDINDSLLRLAYTVEGGAASHHNASIQVFAEGPARCRVVWTTDVLPDTVRPAIAALMEQGAVVMQRTLAKAQSTA